MKNHLLYAVFTAWLSAFSVNNAFTQTSNTNPLLFKAYLIASKATLIKTNAAVQRSFIKEPVDTIEQNWSMAGDNFLNRFYVNGAPVSALFTINGNMIYAVMYGKEKDLPSTARWLIMKEYPGYAISAATEVKQDKRDIWVVQLKNTREVITVRFENDAMEEVQQFNISR